LARLFRYKIGLNWPWEIKDHYLPLVVVPLILVGSAFGFGCAVGQMMVPLIPEAGMAWWLYLLVFMASFGGLMGSVYYWALGLTMAKRGVELLFWVLTSSGLSWLTGSDSISYLLFSTTVVLSGWVYGVIIGLDCSHITPPWEKREPPAEVARRLGHQAELREIYGIKPQKLAVGLIIRHSLRGLLVLLVFYLFIANLSFGSVFPNLSFALFALIHLSCTLGALSLLYLHQLKLLWKERDIYPARMVFRTWLKTACGIIVLGSLVALILPADLSPLAGLGFYNLMESLNQRLAPMFVPSYDSAQRPSVSDQEPLLFKWIKSWFLSSEASLGGRSQVLPWILVLLMFILIGVIVYVARKALRLNRGGREEKGFSLLKGNILIEFFQWLFGWIKRWSRKIFGFIHPEPVKEEQKKRRGAILRIDEVKESPTPQEDSWHIRRLFVRVLIALKNNGYSRKTGETAWEFTERVNSNKPELASDLGMLTEAYLKARYAKKARFSLTFLDHLEKTVSKVLKTIVRVFRKQALS
jgi:hypothetical protein